MISKIFMMRNRPELELDDLYVLKTTDGRFFELGPSGCEINDWVRKIRPIGIGFDMSSFLNGMSIMFISDIVWINENHSWKMVKNRTALAGGPPFSSFEEARLKCVALGWPDPKPIGT